MANADGTNERALLPTNQSVFEYHAHFSPDGQYITFTSEQEDGNGDLYRIVSSLESIKVVSEVYLSVPCGIMEDGETDLALFISCKVILNEIHYAECRWKWYDPLGQHTVA